MNPCHTFTEADAELVAALERQIRMDLTALRDMKLFAATHPTLHAYLTDKFSEFLNEGGEQ